MTATELENATKTFKFSFPTCTNEDLLFKLEVPVEIPYPGSTRELVQRILKMFHIPVYLEDELNEKLADFVSEETRNFHHNRDATLIDQLKNNELDLEGIIKNWEKQFKNVVDFAEQKGSSDEEVFAAAYHKLVHSPALETILQVESAYAKTVMDMIQNRDDDIRKLTKRQTEEMEEKIRLLNTSTTEEEINTLAAKHFEAQSLATGRWDSQLDALKHTQRAEHRTWLMNAINEYQTEEKITPSNSPLCSYASLPPAPTAPATLLEESFTIHLGSQLKQTHNIRLVCADMLDLCARDRTDGGLSLSLYSSELSGAVVVCEGRPSRSPLTSLPRVTDHHFPDLHDQLRRIEETVADPAETRNRSRGERESRRRALRAGDVFVTRHSNLSQHVVFHLVADEDELRSAELSSRHRAVLGLREVLLAAQRNDVASVALPLLLRRELGEDATAAWCLRRAELVLKCVKGFVLEASAAGGARLKTLTAAVPREARALFPALAALLPAVFRVAGPLRPRLPSHEAPRPRV
ncbi:protein C12orf4 homolog [Danaus plexippus]|uniref:protein C12orf4 homolog n=1 Tax=Danaus plexippus TaxID=13037 RepID=UPI002AAF3F78|nr:protein C12orf4 homolog [Danaus plexippus]